jgi:hypothetical protein
MTRDKKAKKAARALKASENVSYTSARRSTPPPPAPPPDDYDPVPPDDDDPGRSTRSVENLVMPYLQHICDNLTDESIDSLGDVEVAGPVRVSEAAVHQLRVDASTIDSQVVEEFEGGTMLCSVFAEASLIVEGLMGKNDATVSAENRLVEILDFHYNRAYALVAITAPQPVEAEFNATVTPDAESVDDVNFVRIAQLTKQATAVLRSESMGSQNVMICSVLVLGCRA